MKRLTIQESEILAQKFRSEHGLSMTEPISTKTVLRKLGILTMYRPLSEKSFGISAKSESGRMFMMVNCNSTRGRQHFTIAHELYHLLYDDSPEPHMCGGVAIGVEKDIFADYFEVHYKQGDYILLCSDGLTNMVEDEKIKEIVLSNMSIDDKSRTLIELANENGGKDNISVVLVEI